MALQRTGTSLSAMFASCGRCFSRIKNIRWPCKCGCTWTVSCSWVCCVNMDRTNRHEDDGDIGLEGGSHRQSTRELPPLPSSGSIECNLLSEDSQRSQREEVSQQRPDFWASIEKVKQVKRSHNIHKKYIWIQACHKSCKPVELKQYL